MAVKKIKEEKQAEKPEKKSERYFYAVGKRKTAIAQVRIYPESKELKGILVNKKEVEKYFPIVRLKETAVAPLLATANLEKFAVAVRISGGGISSQAEAMRLGIARALVKFDETLKKQLRTLGYMTRDARIVERKKPGLKKARRAPQWAKR
jgi:small subunit ribosomal protein S9